MSTQYQDFLLAEFRARRDRNPQYSLRAFARDIDMPASKLSQNLRGLCGISVIKARRIAERLVMSASQQELFIALVESQHARSRVARQQALEAVQRLSQVRISEPNVQHFTLSLAQLAQLKAMLKNSPTFHEKGEILCVVSLSVEVPLEGVKPAS